jgi:hypothetical protein
MSFFSDVDLNKKVDSVVAMMEAGGNVPPGFYRAILGGAKEVTSASKGTPGCELTFEIKGGPFNGATVSDTLWKTDSDRLQDRIILFGLRLGVLVRDPKTGEPVQVEGKSDFMDVLDTEVIIEVIEDEFEGKDGRKSKIARVAFGGIYTKDDKKASEKIGKPPAAKSSTSKTEAKPAEKKKFDTASL